LSVRHGAPVVAAQDDIGQSFISTHRKWSSSLARRSFHLTVAIVRPFATPDQTWFALVGILADGLFH